MVWPMSVASAPEDLGDVLAHRPQPPRSGSARPDRARWSRAARHRGCAACRGAGTLSGVANSEAKASSLSGGSASVAASAAAREVSRLSQRQLQLFDLALDLLRVRAKALLLEPSDGDLQRLHHRASQARLPAVIPAISARRPKHQGLRQRGIFREVPTSRPRPGSASAPVGQGRQAAMPFLMSVTPQARWTRTPVPGAIMLPPPRRDRRAPARPRWLSVHPLWPPSRGRPQSICCLTQPAGDPAPRLAPGRSMGAGQLVEG
jgi:hypothetical protein